MKIINGDCVEEMMKLEENSVDLIITDPPYFMPLKHYSTRKYFNRNFADIGLIEYFFRDVFAQFKRILKPTGRIYIFCDGQSYPLFWYHMFQFCKNVRPLIWDKKTSINGYSWRHQHELILFAEMPETKPVPTGDGDILTYRTVKVGDRKHPAEKPVELLKRFVEKSSEEGDIVLDCFAGGGSLGDACKELNRDFILIEKEKSYYKILKEKFAIYTEGEKDE